MLAAESLGICAGRSKQSCYSSETTLKLRSSCIWVERRTGKRVRASCSNKKETRTIGGISGLLQVITRQIVKWSRRDRESEYCTEINDILLLNQLSIPFEPPSLAREHMVRARTLVLDSSLIMLYAMLRSCTLSSSCLTRLIFFVPLLAAGQWSV